MAAAVTKLPRSAILAHFFERERLAALRALPSSLAARPPHPIPAPNPFIPTYNPESGCWAGPKYSRRRQKELLRAAEVEGKVAWMPIGLKVERKQEIVRSTRKGKGKEAEAEGAVVEKQADGSVEVEVPGSSAVVALEGEDAANIAAAAAAADLPPTDMMLSPNSPVPEPPVLVSTEPAPPEPVTSSHPDPYPLPQATPAPHDPNAPLQWLGLPAPKATADTVHGIKPREKWFKGHKWQREKKGREEETAHRLATMGDRVRDWRQEKKEGKNKKISSLPF